MLILCSCRQNSLDLGKYHIHIQCPMFLLPGSYWAEPWSAFAASPVPFSDPLALPLANQGPSSQLRPSSLLGFQNASQNFWLLDSESFFYNLLFFSVCSFNILHAHCATLVYRQKSSQLLRLVHRTGVEKYLKWNLIDHHSSSDEQLKANIKSLNPCDLVVLEKVNSEKVFKCVAWWRTNRFWCAAKRSSSILSWGAIKVGFSFAASNIRRPADSGVLKDTASMLYGSKPWFSVFPWKRAPG